MFPEINTISLQKHGGVHLILLFQKVLLKYKIKFYGRAKGQIKPKEDWRAVDSPKKQMNEFVLFAFLLFTANKTNSFIRFLEESTVHQSAYDFI